MNTPSHSSPLAAVSHGLRCTLAILTLAATASAADSVKDPESTVDWPAFLGACDPVWEQLPRQWNEGAFAGNGVQGMMVYATLADNRLDFHIGRSDVTDHRKAPDKRTSMGVPGAGVFFDFPRLDIGRMALRPAGKIIDGEMRQDLWNAEITGTIRTDLGVVTFRACTPHQADVNVIDIHSTEKDASGQPAPWHWEFLPGNPASPRAQALPEQAAKASYETNPPPQITEKDGTPVCVQPLLAGGDYATAWREIAAPDGRSSRVFISTANAVPASGQSASSAVSNITAAKEQGEGLLQKHWEWWHTFYPRTFLSIPDKRLEAFYWIQIYKLGSAWREDAPAIDLFGPWFRVSQWPGIWWNLNIQLTYWPVYAGNHLEIGKNFTDLVDSQFDTTFLGATQGKTFGDFVWAMHNYWWQLRFAGDWQAVQDRWVPKARKLATAFVARLKPEASGRLGLPGMSSPEYNGFQPYDDTNYNLGLLRWLLNALIEADARSGQPHTEEVGEWRKTLDAMVDFPADENGLMIGSNQPVAMSHRHFSHLLPLYPLYQMDPDATADRELLLRTVRHWHGIDNGKALAGYSFTGGAAIYASLGLGDEAVAMLNDFLDNKKGGGKVLPNTMYVETAGRNPVIETPLSGASAIMDLLLQSWRGKIRVFPAVPANWKDAAFEHLRAMDGFVVSARRAEGRTAWVRVHSEAGEPCVIKVADWNGPVSASGARTFAVSNTDPGVYSVDLKKGETVLLQPAGTSGSLPRIEPVPATDPAVKNPFGVKRGKELQGDQTWPVAQPTPAKP